MNFKEIPTGTKVPGFYAEIDNSRAAGSSVMPWKVLVIGQTVKSAKCEPTLITSDEDADTKFGAGSQLALMIRAYRKNQTGIETYALPLADVAGDKASLSVDVGGPATVSGEIVLVVDGVRVKTTVSANQAANTIAGNIVTAINAKAQLPVTASATTNGFKLEAKNAGTCGNEISVSVGKTASDIVPDGVTLKVGSADLESAMLASGTGAPDLSESGVNVVSLIANQWYNVIVAGVNDDDNVKILEEELDARWTALRQELGILFFGKSFANVADAQTYYVARNSQVCIPVCLIGAPRSSWERAAAVAGVAADSAKQDPAMPIGNVELIGETAPDEKNDLSFEEKQVLLDAGCSGIDADKTTRTVYVRRLVTEYKKNAAGAADQSYMQPETIFCLSYFRWAWNNRMASKYSRAKCANDEAKFGIGQVILRPSTVKAEAISFYKDMCDAGICQGYEYFVENVECEIDANDKNRINVLLPPEFIKQMFVLASIIQFA